MGEIVVSHPRLRLEPIDPLDVASPTPGKTLGGVSLRDAWNLVVGAVENMVGRWQPTGEQADTDGLKPISGFEFAMRVAQKFMPAAQNQNRSSSLPNLKAIWEGSQN